MIIIENSLEKRPLKSLLMRGLTVPNRDGTVAHGGCTFCTVSGSGDAIVAPDAPIREQFYKEIDFYAPQVARCSEVSGLFSKFYQHSMKRWKSFESAMSRLSMSQV